MALKVFLNQLGQDVISFIEGHGGGGTDPDNPTIPPIGESVSASKVVISTNETLQYVYPNKITKIGVSNDLSKQSTS